MFLPRSAKAGCARWSCLRPLLPHTAKIHFRNLKTSERRRGASWKLCCPWTHPAGDSAPSQPCPQSPACASGLRSSCWKKGTVLACNSVFGTLQGGSAWLTGQIRICQLFCVFYYLHKSDLSKREWKNGWFNRTTFAIIKFGWDNPRGRLRTYKNYCSSVKPDLNQTKPCFLKFRNVWQSAYFYFSCTFALSGSGGD